MGCPDCLDRNERIAWRDSRIAELEREVARLTRECEDKQRMQLAMRAKATEACSAAGGRNERVAELTSTSKRMREERDHYRSKYLETQRQLDEARALLSAAVPMILWCPNPKCCARHIDKGDFATKPHHTHACQECGTVWRSAIVPTCGVQFLGRGSK